jgi:hypothetical protein
MPPAPEAAAPPGARIWCTRRLSWTCLSSVPSDPETRSPACSRGRTATRVGRPPSAGLWDRLRAAVLFRRRHMLGLESPSRVAPPASVPDGHVGTAREQQSGDRPADPPGSRAQASTRSWRRPAVDLGGGLLRRHDVDRPDARRPAAPWPPVGALPGVPLGAGPLALTPGGPSPTPWPSVPRRPEEVVGAGWGRRMVTSSRPAGGVEHGRRAVFPVGQAGPRL